MRPRSKRPSVAVTSLRRLTPDGANNLTTPAYDRGGRPQTGAAFVADERGVAEWSSEFIAADGAVTAIRGFDVFEFEGDLIRRKDAFRKVYA